MDTDLLKETFYSLVAPDLPNDWDVEEAVENLAGLDELRCHSILNQVPVIWPVSHSLCFDYLNAAAVALTCIEPVTLPTWVNRTLDQYEKNGLRSAQRFMADVEENYLCPLRGESGLLLANDAGRLLPYLRGLSAFGISSQRVQTGGKVDIVITWILVFTWPGRRFDARLAYSLQVDASCGISAQDQKPPAACILHWPEEQVGDDSQPNEEQSDQRRLEIRLPVPPLEAQEGFRVG